MERLGFKLIVSAINEELYNEFVKAFDGFEEVEVVFKRFEDTDFDCVVSAANSFGLMDGGVDQCITDYFGVQMMHRVQNRIIQEYAGEQPVGTSIIVPGITFDMIGSERRFDRTKYVAHTPTMRVPRDVMGSDHPYKAMKAAKQMALATFHVMNPPKQINWYYASGRDAQIQESR